MSAPLLWILLPIAVGSFLLLILNERTASLIGGATALILAGIAWFIPIDEALRIGPLSIKIASTTLFLGRSFAISPTEGPLLTIIFGLCALWFFGSEAAGKARQLTSLGLIITGLMVASIAVEPFLFAALLIEMAVLVAVPLISPMEQKPGRGTIRFLVYQTLGMPFILFAGWMLAGVEASPGDLALTIQATAMLGLGFAFLLAIFPLYSWIPQVMEESSPYVIGFLLWLLPTITIIFGMGFLDRYAWLRTSETIIAGIRALGILMFVTGGIWAAFQRHIGRLMAYTVIAETGVFLLAASLFSVASTDLIFLFLIPRGLAFAIWALSLSILKTDQEPYRFATLQGFARTYPFASAGLILATLSSAGFPLLAGFPPRLALWEGLAHVSTGDSAWFLLGTLGLMIGAIRMMAVLVMEKEETKWQIKETMLQSILLGIGIAGLFILGIFPQAVQPILEKMPLLFQHLGH